MIKKCKWCGSYKIKRNGRPTYMNKGRHKVVYQAYKCNVCGGNTVERIQG